MDEARGDVSGIETECGANLKWLVSMKNFGNGPEPFPCPREEEHCMWTGPAVISIVHGAYLSACRSNFGQNADWITRGGTVRRLLPTPSPPKARRG